MFYLRQSGRASLRVLFLAAALAVGGGLAASRAMAETPVTAAASDWRSDRLSVEVIGSGPDVILIPGLASTSDVWARTANRLDDRYRVHLVSIRGFGNVPAGANVDGALVAPVAAELRRYIASQGLRRPAVIGHSMGGLVALRAAADVGPRSAGSWWSMRRPSSPP